MTRRELFTLLFVTPFIKPAPRRDSFCFFCGEDVCFGRSPLPPAMYGIPYHQSDASTSEWLGIKRA